jgi:hypothetical protein
MPHLPDHATHDPELIAAYAAGDATGSALAQATELVAGCADCAALHRDLRAIATALPELPAPVRPRDFTLTPEQAATLRPSGWRGIVAAFASPRFRLAAPLGTGLAAAGLAGLLLATPGGILPAAQDATTSGAAGAAGAAEQAADTPIVEAAPGDAAGGAALAAPAEAPSAAAASMAPQEFAPGSSTIRTLGDGGVPAPSPEASAAAAAGLAGDEPSPAERDALQAKTPPAASEPAQPPAATDQVSSAAVTGNTPWVVVSIALVLAGVALVVLRLAARRASA